ncbi:zinc-binding dehydrogenase [Nocardia terrae]|uniref:zinc-binding dehydrogenase n=1 Tax=Nocardia terrae TaxID=2675851 RepID=UPI0018DF7BF7|nr:zinc-binding dehydrogenase [Nocardia terrae]
MSTTMRAAICVAAGGPEVLEVRELPVPRVREGWSLVRVMGAGLNRSELRTRQGHSPSVRFPRVLGIECVGTVAASTDPRLPEGTTVAAVMGEMGREFDGGYAEYALLPNSLLMPIETELPWEVLAALPETYLTAQGAMDALGVAPGDRSRLLIRGGTSSVGMAAASIASGYGLDIAATTRQPGKAAALTGAGVDHVLLDDGGSPAETIREFWPEGPDYVLDLVGSATLADSLRLVRRGGTVCVSGSLSGWLIPDFEPIAMIPPGTKLTAFHSDSYKGETALLQRVVREVEAGVYRPNVDRVFRLDDIAEAHRYMEDNRATGKLVMLPRASLRGLAPDEFPAVGRRGGLEHGEGGVHGREHPHADGEHLHPRRVDRGGNIGDCEIEHGAGVVHPAVHGSRLLVGRSDRIGHFVPGARLGFGRVLVADHPELEIRDRHRGFGVPQRLV